MSKLKHVPFLEVDSTTTIDALFIQKEWGRKINLIAVFKDINTNEIFKLNIYKNHKEEIYGIREDFKHLPLNTLMKLKIEPRISKKTNKVYTKLIDEERLK